MPNLVTDKDRVPENVLNQNPNTAAATMPTRNEDLEMAGLDFIEETRKFLSETRKVHKQNIRLKEQNQAIQNECDRLRQQMREGEINEA